jgi:hypothetical protein
MELTQEIKQHILEVESNFYKGLKRVFTDFGLNETYVSKNKGKVSKQDIQDWLLKHDKADYIKYNADTGFPISATYNAPRYVDYEKIEKLIKLIENS